jgi:putative transposase
MPDRSGRANRTTCGPSPHFIPGTNAIESINYQLRKVSKTRGQFPSDDAVYKILYLAVCDIEIRDKSRGGNAKKNSILSRGSVTHGWTAALNQFEIIFPGRLPAQI